MSLVTWVIVTINNLSHSYLLDVDTKDCNVAKWYFLFDDRGFQLQREGDGQGRVAVLVKVDVKDSGVRRISWLHRRLSSNQLTGGWVAQRGSRLGTLPQEQICSNSAKRLSIVKVQSDGWKDYFTSMEREKGRIAVIRPLWWFWENQQEAWRNINFEKLQLQLKMLGLRQLRCKHYCVKLEI